ncbi:DNA polymerase eta-like [Cyprinus carpio]|uniref:DNA polymerase eta-like n=1 Tax=Cyprinus carpio TaxID=7962 RepID=A0A9Q9YPX2_CYPCA|nr:DNA polymerase eta-like [Cyprinus carpio]
MRLQMLVRWCNSLSRAGAALASSAGPRVTGKTEHKQRYERAGGQTADGGSFSRCCALVRYDAVKMTSDSLAIIKSLNTAGSHQEAWSPALTGLLSASKFSDVPSSSSRGIADFLSSDAPSTQSRLASTQTPKTQLSPKSPPSSLCLRKLLRR